MKRAGFGDIWGRGEEEIYFFLIIVVIWACYEKVKK